MKRSQGDQDKLREKIQSAVAHVNSAEGKEITRRALQVSQENREKLQKARIVDTSTVNEPFTR